ncbi:MAG TPA: indolepyruvate oxidoreductase subunit beta [Syntrophorhabdaceae bacterium]|jgi:indolepyruvate ferredoxin oxidoreductase beta subunit
MNLDKEPINLIITGVGGQGNILISKLLGQAFMEEGYTITIGETYGATQRGGSVASHVRISKEKVPYSPVTPKGRADIILGLEPSETMRMVTSFGYEGTMVVTNTRPIHPLEVAIGEVEYPSQERIEACMKELVDRAWYVNASDIALGLGNALLTNIVMTGALMGTSLLPLGREKIERQLKLTFKGGKQAVNLEAFELGYTAVT